MKRRIGVVTVARSDYSILYPLLRAIEADPALELDLIVAGMHLAPEFGDTAAAIEADGFAIAERVAMLLPADDPRADRPEGIAIATGRGVIGFGEAFARNRPDLLVVMGDRFEMFGAAIAALPLRIPVAHIHGGELSEGAIDDAMRHAMTKLSHLHFTATEAYRDRVIQLGEEPWRVVASGAPALDNLHVLPRLSGDELKRRFGLGFAAPPLVVTYHPTTLGALEVDTEIDALFAALRRAGRPVVVTAPNADAGGRHIARRIAAFAAEYGQADVVSNLGLQGYYSLLALAAAMVGNSSSGIIEAASFALPVVNIGDRQKGRLAPRNVIHVAAETGAIAEAIEKACSAGFRRGLAGLANPYGTGQAVPRIVETLRSVELGQRLLQKSFHDIKPARVGDAAA
jgi:UDP-hydrolysing UDP-N-acetyl-D-glucosamine 2-epimerase